MVDYSWFYNCRPCIFPWISHEIPIFHRDLAGGSARGRTSRGHFMARTSGCSARDPRVCALWRLRGNSQRLNGVRKVDSRLILGYCIVLHGIVLHCIALYCIALYCIVLYCIVLYCIALYCIVLHCIVLYCIVLYCIVLYCIVLHCIVLYCIDSLQHIYIYIL